MDWTLIQLRGFTSLWKSERLSDDDLQGLESQIMRDPGAAPVMRGTGGLRKIRFAPPSRGTGKSGAMRVGYAQFPEHRRVYLITLFLKSDQENLSAAARNLIRSTLEELAAELSKSKRHKS
jgi:hypothetical protein